MQTSSNSKQFRSRSFTQRKRTQQEVTPGSTARSGFRPACSMAEFNKVKTFKKNSQPERYQLGQPIRIVIPAFFNVPQYENLAGHRPRVKSPHRQTLDKSNETSIKQGKGDLYLTGVGVNQTQIIEQTAPVLPSATLRKIKDLKMISLAMRRQKNLKEQSRTYYCSAVLYDNLGDYRQAVDEYEKFLRIALFLQDRCSIELVLNSIGIAYMKLEQFATAVEYHSKQYELAETSRNRFIGRVNSGLCREKLGEFNQALDLYIKAYEDADGGQKRLCLAKQLVEGILVKSAGNDALAEKVQQFLKSNTKQDRMGSSMVRSYVRLAEMDATRHDYARSRLKFAKALQFGYLNDETKRIAQAKQYMKQAKLGYAISTAENKMQIFLKTYSDNISKYKL